ncbi:ABC transporter substrate-binding protein [Loktanella agnita]|uniref:ABC transporter substrate-binding protein n=1 Tax=Loktanella agnita TaxID=287097 RepID=UPI00398595D5
MVWQGLRIAAVLAFLLAFFTVVYIQRSQMGSVLVIHSYNTDYDWVVAINEGLEREFETRRDVAVLYHYMDLKNHTDADFRRTATNLANRAIDEAQPDVLVLFDDVAQQLVGMHYAGDETEIAVVYGGVNAEPEVYYGNNPNVTGILERKPLLAIRETLLAMGTTLPPRDGPMQVQFIGDLSASITAEIPFFETIDWAPLVWLPPVQVETFNAWQAAVARAEQEADILLLTNYQQVRAAPGEAFVRPAAQVMQWTEANAAVPVLGLGWTNGQDGAMLTVSSSPFEQGEIAARMALAIIDGAAPAALAVRLPEQFLVHLCKTALDRRGIAVPDFYEAFARATDNFYEDC